MIALRGSQALAPQGEGKTPNSRAESKTLNPHAEVRALASLEASQHGSASCENGCLRFRELK